MITSIRLQNFRSYKDSAFELSSSTNIVVGPNASGKTNLLEAIYFVCLYKPPRSLDNSFVRNGSKWSRLDANTNTNQQRTVKLQLTDNKISKSFEIDGEQKKKITKEIIVPVTMFEPNQLYRLTTSPEVRRAFIDELAIDLKPELSIVFKNYQKTLAQRNALLKSGQKKAKENIFAWDLRLSDLGEIIYIERNKIIKSINKNLSNHYSFIASKKSEIEIIYSSKQSPNNYSSSMLANLEKNFELDLIRGYTSIGPHRDDASIVVEGQQAKNFASRGETRTLVLAIKKCETELTTNAYKQKPILLLDDVFSELDGKRRQQLTSFLSGNQSIITTTDADIVAKNFAQKANLIYLK